MRSVTANRLIPKNTDEVWKNLCRPGYFGLFINSFSPLPKTYNHRLTKKDGSGGDSLEMGDTIELRTKGGKHVLFLQVDTWEPEKSLSLVNKGPDGERDKKYIMKISFTLTQYGEGRTRVKTELVMILLNGFLETVSLLMPLGFVHAFCLGRALRKLESQRPA